MLVADGFTLTSLASVSAYFIYLFGMLVLRYTSTSSHNLLILSCEWVLIIKAVKNMRMNMDSFGVVGWIGYMEFII